MKIVVTGAAGMIGSNLVHGLNAIGIDDVIAVESDVGMMGGSGAHEYMAPGAAGENEVALAPGYAANIEVARALARPVELPDGADAPQEVSTPVVGFTYKIALAFAGKPVPFIGALHALNAFALAGVAGIAGRQARVSGSAPAGEPAAV